MYFPILLLLRNKQTLINSRNFELHACNLRVVKSDRLLVPVRTANDSCLWHCSNMHAGTRIPGSCLPIRTLRQVPQDGLKARCPTVSEYTGKLAYSTSWKDVLGEFLFFCKRQYLYCFVLGDTFFQRVDLGSLYLNL